MNTITSLALCLPLLLLACNSIEEGDPQEDQVSDDLSAVPEVTWKRYIDTINVGFTLGFDYPDTLQAMSIENARAAVEKGTGDDPQVEQMIWSIWMNDTMGFSIEEDVQGYLEGGEDGLQGPFNIDIDGSIGKRMVIGSGSAGSPIEIVYFTKHGTAFSIVNRRPDSQGFGRFVRSIHTQVVAISEQ